MKASIADVPYRTDDAIEFAFIKVIAGFDDNITYPDPDAGAAILRYVKFYKPSGPVFLAFAVEHVRVQFFSLTEYCRRQSRVLLFTENGCPFFPGSLFSHLLPPYAGKYGMARSGLEDAEKLTLKLYGIVKLIVTEYYTSDKLKIYLKD
ncbi:MAG: hypothetical protein JW913_03060 [Chitinispirillaceae bacterium]|nr:hypothetical protein [Chitinispirillaceae bacterium]